VRAIFHEEDEAMAVAARLRTDGFDAEVLRERLAGEDDDEDHPWAVVTDAPAFALEILAEEHDGWVDHDEPPPPPAPPLDLPAAPRRIKGHFTD
jgi:8-oxo-dGTP diphosphatase